MNDERACDLCRGTGHDPEDPNFLCAECDGQGVRPVSVPAPGTTED